MFALPGNKELAYTLLTSGQEALSTSIWGHVTLIEIGHKTNKQSRPRIRSDDETVG